LRLAEVFSAVAQTNFLALLSGCITALPLLWTQKKLLQLGLGRGAISVDVNITLTGVLRISVGQFLLSGLAKARYLHSAISMMSANAILLMSLQPRVQVYSVQSRHTQADCNSVWTRSATCVHFLSLSLSSCS
jgi:hypothetical protein